ncbi:MAG: hypothetical protein GKR90_16795 [Pseudomonadales bacterium]|nr:hypothetical protein [Pseudomonadales bacterium]
MGGVQDKRKTAVFRWLMIYSRPLIAALLIVNIFVAGTYSYLTTPANSGSLIAASTANVEDASADILLLSELPTLEVLTADLMVEQAIRECRVWGPRSTVKEFDDLVTVLDSDGGFPEVKSVEVQAAPTYMVFVDARDRSSQSRQIMQELKAVEVDNFRIQREEGDIISVGVFSRRDLADRQQQKVADLGYPTDVEVMERSQTVFTLQAYIDASSPHYVLSSHECSLDQGDQVSQYSLH